MSSHTPGPWRYVPQHYVDNNYMLIHCSADPNEGDNLRGYCGLANARLIAAAPELLESLEYAIRMVPELATVPGVKAAIAKATGETP